LSLSGRRNEKTAELAGKIGRGKVLAGFGDFEVSDPTLFTIRGYANIAL